MILLHFPASIYFIWLVANQIDWLASLLSISLSVRKVLCSIPGPVKSGECRHRFAAAATFLRSCVAQVLTANMDPATRYTLWRNTASIMKIRFFLSRLKSRWKLTFETSQPVSRQRYRQKLSKKKNSTIFQSHQVLHKYVALYAAFLLKEGNVVDALELYVQHGKYQPKI